MPRLSVPAPSKSWFFDNWLTLSIPRNSLPLNMFHCDLLKNFDPLSVYRGFVVDQVARARTARSAKLQRLS